MLYRILGGFHDPIAPFVRRRFCRAMLCSSQLALSQRCTSVSDHFSFAAKGSHARRLFMARRALGRPSRPNDRRATVDDSQERHDARFLPPHRQRKNPQMLLTLSLRTSNANPPRSFGCNIRAGLGIVRCRNRIQTLHSLGLGMKQPPESHAHAGSDNWPAVRPPVPEEHHRRWITCGLLSLKADAHSFESVDRRYAAERSHVN